MVKKVFIVPHTHWDREWFFTSSTAKIYLLKDLKDVIDCLANDIKYHSFLLDGQASLIEDYLKWRPQDMDRVKKLVKNKRLILGPWYTQTDQFMVSAESIVNNLRIGMQECDKLGGYMNIAYVPDSFGQESSMPQIYREFDIHDAVLYRGFSLSSASKSEFIWQGEDGSEVTVYRMACGYFIGGVIDETKLAELMTEEPFKTVTLTATTNNLLFPNGSDMAPIRFDLPKFTSKLNHANAGKFTFKVASLEEYIKAVRQQNPLLKRISGEQDCGKDMRVHKSIYSSRADIKQLNTKLQFYLSNIMEPILTLGNHFGFEYPEQAVNAIWKKMFKNAAHDSMGNCVSDRVNEDIEMRYKEVQDLATGLVELTMREISTRIENANHPITLTVFNSMPVIRNEVLHYTLYSPSRAFSIRDMQGSNIQFEITNIKDVTKKITDATIQLDPGKQIYHPQKVYQIDLDIECTQIPSFGYKQLYLSVLPDQERHLKRIVEGKMIENEFYRIEVNDDGSLNILDKSNQYLYQNQAILEENGDDGDSYNYSPPRKDMHIFSTQQSYKVYQYLGKLKNQLIINFNFKIPSNLTKRAQKVVDTTMPVSLEVTLTKNSKIIAFKINVDNRKSKSHRLCINFDSEIVTKTSIADMQFGTVKRQVVKEKELTLWRQETDKWQEMPISINTMQSFVAISNNTRCMAVIPQGVREYECIGKNHSIMRLTIFRTYGMLGKKNLLYRPGRASGDETVVTPQAQLQKKLSFEFALKTLATTYDQSSLANEVKQWDTPLQIYEYAEFLNGRLTFPFNPVKRKYQEELSLFKLESNLVTSTIKTVPGTKSYEIRLYNPLFHEVGGKIVFTQTPKLVKLVNLKGVGQSELLIENNQVVLPKLKHAKFITVYCQF